MHVRSAARRWAETWERCWALGEVDPIVALYDDAASFRSHPFRDERRGREGVRAYVDAAFAVEEAVEAVFAEPLCEGERALVEWWATLYEDGEEITLCGCSLLRFGADGLCLSQRDYWHRARGRVPPPWPAGGGRRARS